jgi:hypothetical protein
MYSSVTAPKPSSLQQDLLTCHADENLYPTGLQLDKQRAAAAGMGRLQHVCSGIQLWLSF